jgi:hypothetical protein
MRELLVAAGEYQECVVHQNKWNRSTITNLHANCGTSIGKLRSQ